MTNLAYFKSIRLKLQENNGLWTWSIQREINDLIPGNEITRNPDGSWKMTSTQVRMGVFPSTGYNPGTITTTKELELEKKATCKGQMTGKT